MSLSKDKEQSSKKPAQAGFFVAAGRQICTTQKFMVCVRRRFSFFRFINLSQVGGITDTRPENGSYQGSWLAMPTARTGQVTMQSR
ncbi:MAG: hypothetical protein WCA63_01410 [Gallionella sp.]